MDKIEKVIDKLETLLNEGKRFGDLDDESLTILCEEQNVILVFDHYKDSNPPPAHDVAQIAKQILLRRLDAKARENKQFIFLPGHGAPVALSPLSADTQPSSDEDGGCKQTVSVENAHGEVVIHYEANGVRKSIVAGLDDYSWLISKCEMDRSWERVRQLAHDYENGTPEISLKTYAAISNEADSRVWPAELENLA